MADPILANVVRAQCVWEGVSGLPTDRYVTSWAFVRKATGVADGETQRDEVAERLREFWLEPVAPSPVCVADFIPDVIASRGLQIRCYDLGEAPPREPHIYDYQTTKGSTANPIPEECAITLSFYAGRNLPRLRGRIYLGPLTVASVADAGHTYVASSVQDALVKAADRLALGTGVGDDMQWGVLSQRDAEIRPVTAGWVDNSFDTIRSRGPEASERVEWPAA